jgi:hypothetical protein
MSELPDASEVEGTAKGAYRFDFAQVGRILKAMDFLRGEAAHTASRKLSR